MPAAEPRAHISHEPRTQARITRRVLTFVAALGGAFAVAVTPASALMTQTFPVGASCSAQGQLCAPVTPIVSLSSVSPLMVTYTSGPASCADLSLLLFIDGQLVGSTAYTPPDATSSITVPWPADGQAHVLGYEGEGRTGGCNHGVVYSWGGTLTVTHEPPPPPPAALPATCDRAPTVKGLTLKASVVQLGRRRPGRSSLVTPYGRKLLLEGRLTAGKRAPIGGAPVCIVESGLAPGAAGSVSSLTTDAKGHFSLAFRAARSSRFSFSYRGGFGGAAASVTVRVRASLTLRASRKVLRNGRLMVLSGNLLNKPLPSGVVVDLEARVGPDRWQLFGGTFARSDGRFSYTYRFTRTTGHQVYTLRARVPQYAGYPFVSGVSRPVYVSVSG